MKSNVLDNVCPPICFLCVLGCCYNFHSIYDNDYPYVLCGSHFFFFLIELKLQCAVFPIMLGPVAVIVSLKGMGNMVPVSKQSLSALENVLCVKHTDSGSMTHRIVIVTSATSCLSWFCFWISSALYETTWWLCPKIGQSSSSARAVVWEWLERVWDLEDSSSF